MSMTAGAATVSADSNGNVTIGGTGFAADYASANAPSITAAQVLALKAAINDSTKFQTALNAIYVDGPNAMAYVITYIKTNAVVVGGTSLA